MNHSAEIVAISPLPIVILGRGGLPNSGALVPLSAFCIRRYSESSACKDHYAKMIDQPLGQCVECPHGLSTCSMEIGSTKYAFTGFIPFPRQGSDQERIVAKSLPEHKIATSALHRYAECLQNVYDNLLTAGEAVIRQYSFALHEIRKLNRTIKQTSERMQMKDYDWSKSADDDLIRVFKASEMMSTQFEVVEVIANEGLANLPLGTKGNLYKLFDKCAHIVSPDKKILIRGSSAIEPMVWACDKTIPIIPTVLLLNAMKYKVPGTDVDVDIGVSGSFVQVRVQNRVPAGTRIDSRVFERGFRGVIDSDGSGHGLFLARIVAVQHLGTIEIVENGDRGIVAFMIKIPSAS